MKMKSRLECSNITIPLSANSVMVVSHHNIAWTQLLFCCHCFYFAASLKISSLKSCQNIFAVQAFNNEEGVLPFRIGPMNVGPNENVLIQAMQWLLRQGGVGKN